MTWFETLARALAERYHFELDETGVYQDEASGHYVIRPDDPVVDQHVALYVSAQDVALSQLYREPFARSLVSKFEMARRKVDQAVLGPDGGGA